ncbi:Phosphoserine phosphatase RsbP [invertebrate metagenome]|uniref:Phosphoserine phosphatase RsbP n=1 Tax=invertebrate metagenome TaxID=1711999 RepID=A0A2H9T833_9ZZZZ
MKILIIDDAPDQTLLLSIILKKLGHSILTANNSQKALKLLSTHNNIHIIISDWVMPQMNGIQLCDTIRKNNYGRYLYFILLTSKADNQSVIEGINAGADDFLTKPVNVDELKARLQTAFRVIHLEKSLAEKNEALQNALSTIEKDLQVAAETQESLLVKPTVLLNKVECKWFFQPSRYLGGDMFGYSVLDDSHVFFYQLDVSGHGIPSALFSFTLNNILSNHMNGKIKIFKHPSTLLKLLNQQFSHSSKKNIYFTILCGVINTTTGQTTLSRAGHPEPIHIQNNQIYKITTKGGVPIGMLSDQTYQETSLQLKKGDHLFLYSDGLVECENKNQEQYGDEKLLNFFKKKQGNNSDAIIQSLHKTITEWHQEETFQDDVTYLLLKWL